MPEARRTYEEEQEAVTAAVIHVMHTLMGIAADTELEIHYRLCAASEILEYARDTSSPAVEYEFEDETLEEGESEGE